MYSWWKISLLLCIFGFLKELRPSEPYIYNFLVDHRWRNVTATEVYQEVYPVGTYSYLVLLVVVFLVTDLCRYKPLIVICGLSGVTIWGMLLWTKTLLELQILEVIYGIFMSTEVAYYTYIYAKVEKEHFQLVTSHTRAAILAGRGTSSVLAQLLISFKLMDYRQLNYITFSALIAASIWSILLPTVKKSIYFHQSEERQTFSQKSKGAFTLMKVHFVESFCHGQVVKWSVLYAMLTAGFIQCQTYMQPLWSEIHKQDSEYNGIIEAGLTFLGFLMALAAGYIKINWTLHGNITVVLCCLLQGALMIISSQGSHVWIAYVSYVLFGGLFNFVVTIASAQIAKYLSEDSYGLVFGFNTFIGISLQSLLTVLFVKGLFNFGIRNQFLTYGVYHILIAVPYFVLYLTAYFRKVSSSLEINAVVFEKNKTSGIVNNSYCMREN